MGVLSSNGSKPCLHLALYLHQPPQNMGLSHLPYLRVFLEHALLVTIVFLGSLHLCFLETCKSLVKYTENGGSKILSVHTWSSCVHLLTMQWCPSQ